MKLNLAQKGIILVSVPLVFELIFIGALAFLLMQAKEESSRAFHAANIGDRSNILIRDIFELTSMTRGEFSQALSSDWYKSTIAKIRTDLQELQLATKDNFHQSEIVQESVDAGEEALLLLERIRTAFESGDTVLAFTRLNALKGELESCVKRMVSRDLIAMAQEEKQTAEKCHAQQLISRAQIKGLIIIGIIFNVIITILIAMLFSKKITSKLNNLVENNFRLANGFPLNPTLVGEDEIAILDQTFHEMADSLAEAKQKERSMIDHSIDVICTLDRGGRITAINPACERTFGYTVDSVIQMNIRSILLEDDIKAFNKFLPTVIEEKTESKFECRVKSRKGGIVDVLWSVHWVESEQSFFCVGHDITSRKEMERLKQKFMAMVSHDLRTPLATISNYMEMLGEGLFGELTERGQHLLNVAESNSRRMLSLINDLLDLERAEFGGLKLDCSIQPLSELLDQAVKSIHSLAFRKQIRFDLSPTDLKVMADRSRIFQVLVNLISNAIKFSAKNSTVQIKTEKNNNMAVVKIVDQGRGIPDDMKHRIFESFQQVEIADAVDKGGSGLGLAICKALVELHGGSIGVENNPDQGSTFFFTLPLAQTAANIGNDLQ